MTPIRIRLDIAYDGADFSGWATQPDRRTVQATLEAAIAQVLRLEESPPSLTVAGRTDAGVHASGQVAHFDMDRDVVPKSAVGLLDNPGLALVRRLRGVLPPDLTIKAASVAPKGFDARFGATARHYRYLLSDGPPDPLSRRSVALWPRSLDAAAMAVAAATLVGEHDFAAFCKRRASSSTQRLLTNLSVVRHDAFIEIRADGKAFCHNQVRSMVGALIAVGEGRRPVEWPRQTLDDGIRVSGLTVAPALGLTLLSVDYD